MASSRKDDTAAAAQQLGSMSLGESAEKEDSETEPTKNGTTPTKKLCSACGEKSDALMKCRDCKCVWYCDRKCQNRHWKEHKKECKPIKKALAKRGGKLNLGNELDVGPFEKPPPREECPICMRALPIYEGLQMYSFCCGKTLCGGCDYQHKMKGAEQDIRQTVDGGLTVVRPRTCAFCRTVLPNSDEENLVSLRTRVDLEDPVALRNMAIHYGRGELGLPVDQTKCIDLLRQSAGLGFPGAQRQLGTFHYTGEMGLEQNEKEARTCWKKAAEGGHILAWYNLGCADASKANHIASMRHFRLSASGGYRFAIKALIEIFDAGFFKHGDLVETLQVFYLARAELKSEDRDKYLAYLKTTGEYEAEYD